MPAMGNVFDPAWSHHLWPSIAWLEQGLTAGLVDAAWSRGLGAVINSQGIMQSPVVREHARIPDDQIILKSIALGWPDHAFTANAVVSERRHVADAAVFLGF